MKSLQDKVIVVTGGAQGLGAAICATLAEDGATVIAADMNQQNLDNISHPSGKIHGMQLNVANGNHVEEVIAAIIDQFGQIDVVINNAGIDFTLSVEEISHDQFSKVIDVNLLGPFFVSKAVYGHMKSRGSGHIVNIASTAAKRAWPNASAYHASKWGLLGFSHALHTEARKDNIKVTAIVAGGMKTPFIIDRFPEAEPFLQDPKNVAETIKYVLYQPDETVIPEVMVIPMKESSWP